MCLLRHSLSVRPASPMSRATCAHATVVSKASALSSPALRVVVRRRRTAASSRASSAAVHARALPAARAGSSTFVQRSRHCTSVRVATRAAILDHGRNTFTSRGVLKNVFRFRPFAGAAGAGRVSAASASATAACAATANRNASSSSGRQWPFLLPGQSTLVQRCSACWCVCPGSARAASAQRPAPRSATCRRRMASSASVQLERTRSGFRNAWYRPAHCVALRSFFR